MNVNCLAENCEQLVQIMYFILQSGGFYNRTVVEECHGSGEVLPFTPLPIHGEIKKLEVMG